jgi:UDP-glucose:(heptosyl)LPS alpha-1,3-glucosyltransferase
VNIAIVAHHYERGDGTSQYAVELVERFATEHDVTVYAARFGIEPPSNVARVAVPAMRGRAYATILTFPAVFARVRRAHDVVHAQGWVASRADVVTTHIVLAAWREAAAGAGVTPPLGERLLGGFVARRERELVRRAGAVIVPSTRAAADVARCYGRVHGVHVVAHGFTPAPSLPARDRARAELGLPADRFVALYAGDARKGFDTALTAIAETPNVHLLVASRSSPRAYLVHARLLGIENRVHWPGALSDMGRAYAAADVLLHPTIYDTFALVVAEAMACGVPVIVSPEAGIGDLIRHRVSGWIAGGAGVAAALAALRDDPPLRRRLTAAARAVAAARTWDQVARETLGVYRRVTGRP